MGRLYRRICLVVLLIVAFALNCLGTAAAQDLTVGSPEPADRILVEKEARRMSLFAGTRVLKTYQIALGHQPIGHKIREGDGKTPEGFYRIDGRNPDSRFHLALHISYPSGRDKKRAHELGVPPGSDIMIHGIGDEWAWLGRLHRLRDWTQGCIAVSNKEIEEIWKRVPDGTPIEIKP